MAATCKFTTWLNSKLQELNTDESVFGSYILGIMEGDETQEEKQDALEGILSEILTDNIDELIRSIFEKWLECSAKKVEPSTKPLDVKVEEQLAKLLETTKVQSIVKERQYTEEEKRIREQILAQYSETAISDEEYDPAQSDEEAEKHGGGGGGGSKSGLERNTNFSDVVQLQKEKREQARIESAAKKQKDKEDREKQKQMREEKKEKRKTVKGERKR